jgi:hypothetical protein
MNEKNKKSLSKSGSMIEIKSLQVKIIVDNINEYYN